MKKPVSTPAAPKAIGPYSQAVEARGARTLFLSGQIPLDPATGELVKGDIEVETVRVMENLRAVLAAAGAGFGDVVRTTIFLADLADFARVNEVYGRSFPADPPARATVQVAALPRGARVEIDAIAVLD
jgi:2-iminobutanoate/2-iminopropanoate deaminase